MPGLRCCRPNCGGKPEPKKKCGAGKIRNPTDRNAHSRCGFRVWRRCCHCCQATQLPAGVSKDTWRRDVEAVANFMKGIFYCAYAYYFDSSPEYGILLFSTPGQSTLPFTKKLQTLKTNLIGSGWKISNSNVQVYKTFFSKTKGF